MIEAHACPNVTVTGTVVAASTVESVPTLPAAEVLPL
jgi:hypothetical protein